MAIRFPKFYLRPRNPAPDLFRNVPAGKRQALICLLGQTMIPDAEQARADAEWLAAIKQKFAGQAKEIASLSDDAKLAAIAELGEQAVLKSLKSLPRQARCHLGISSGLDSRFIYAVARKDDSPLATFSFGGEGYTDFEWPVSAGILSLKGHTQFNVNDCAWSLPAYERWTSIINDLPISPRIAANLAMAESASDAGPFFEINGYFNGPRISLQPRKMPKSGRSWRTAIEYTLSYCDNFNFAQFFERRTLREIYPTKPFLPKHLLPYDHQSFLPFREFQRIRPVDYGPVSYLLPFLDEAWIGFWLNAPSDAFGEKSLFNKMLAKHYPETFPDLVHLYEKEEAPIRKRRIQHYKSKLMPPEQHGRVCPHNAAEHFCFYACYQNNVSFRDFVDTSLQRLQGRGLFNDSVINDILHSFLTGNASAAKQIKGLVTVDVVLASGRLG